MLDCKVNKYTLSVSSDIFEPRHVRQVIASLIVNLYMILQVLLSCIMNRLIFVSINCGGLADKNIDF